MNFNIIDGDNDWLDLTPRFIELYNNPENTVNKIREKLNINLGTYRKLRRHCIEHGLITKRKAYRPKKRTCRTHPRYYTHSVTKGIEYYHVNRRYGDKVVVYATFKNASQAKRMVELLIECDWDKSRVEELKERVLNE
jgi:hypothetical protein